MSTNRVYGIDLGTTYSCIAYVDEHGKPVVVPNAEGRPTTPSVVFFENPGNTVVGQTAKEVAVMYPDRVISAVKRSMGDPNWVSDHDGNTYHPQDISSFILRKLINDAEVVTGDKITDVVITCPAYFGVTEKEATKQAGVLAGLNVRYVIPEPTAAAIAYGIDQSEDQVILVYDLGGGTFDITLIDIKANGIKVVCTGGDNRLGGKDWDETIASWFAEQFSNEKGIPAENLTSDLETWQDLLNLAEKAKVALSTCLSRPQKIRHDIDSVTVTLTREKFDELTANWLERTVSLTEELLATARDKGYSKVDKLLLVGGSTYMPQIMDAVEAKFPFEVRHYDPNQSVAKGAALFGFKCYLDDRVVEWIVDQTGADAPGVTVDAVSEEIRVKAEQAVAQEHGIALPGLQKLTRPKIQNVTSKSFGIVVVDQSDQDVVNNLIVVDDVVPCTLSQKFRTHEDGQDGVLLRCVENTQRLGPDDDHIPFPSSPEEQERVGLFLVGTAEIRFTHALPKGSPIEITFALAEDGRLTVLGQDLTTNQEAVGEFKTDAILTTEQLEEKKSRNLAIAVA